MIRRTGKFLLRAVTALAAGVVVLLALGFWRLSQGPLPLDFLVPYVQRGIVTADGSIKLVARTVTLNWAGWDHTLEIRVGTLEAINSNGTVLATVPEAAVNLSLVALLHGELAPTAVRLEKLLLHVVVREDGQFDLSLPREDKDTAVGILPVLVGALQSGTDSGPISRLRSVSVVHAEIVFEDRQKAILWRAPDMDLVLNRDEEGVLAEGHVAVVAEGQHSDVTMRGLYSSTRNRLALAFNFEGLRPSVFASLDPSLERLKEVDVAFSGTVDAVLTGGGALQSLTLNVASGPGKLGKLDMFEEPRHVQQVVMRGEANLAERAVRLDALQIDFGGVTATTTGAGTISRRRLDFKGQLAIDHFAIDELGKYWPTILSPGGRRWALNNVSGGTARNLTLDFRFTGSLDDPSDQQFVPTHGGAEADNVTVNYMRPLPPVEGAAAEMVIDEKSVRFVVKAGHVGDIALNSGEIDLLNLDKPDQDARIDLTSTGPISSMLKLLEEPKVGLSSTLGLTPARVSGEVAARVILQFPLIDALKANQIEYSASASSRGLAMKEMAPGVDLTDGALTMQLNGQDMDVRGTGRLGGVPADIRWSENFRRTSAVRRRYEVRATATAADLAKLGVDLGSYVTGPIGITAIYQENQQGTGKVDAALNLKQTALQAPEIHWRKNAGQDASGRLSFEVRSGHRPNEFDVEIAAADLDTKARLALSAPGNGIEKVTIDRFVGGRNSFRGSVVRSGPNYTIALSGERFDLAPFLSDDQTASADQTKPPAQPTGPILDIAVDLREVLTKQGKLDGASGRIRLQGGRVLEADLVGRVGTSVSISAKVTPEAKGRTLQVTTTDAGAVLQSLGWLNGVVGGKLNLTGQFDDTKPGSPLRGRLVMDRYRLVKTPVVKDVLSVTPLTDALSAFSGSGLEFNQLIAPFTWDGGVLTLRSARTAGSAVGITANGKINTNNDTVQIEGAIVPAYVINNLLGNIPLLGPLITGGAGGGLFAVNYAVEGPVSKPKVSTNPLSALAPGFLRNLFGAGSGEDDSGDAESKSLPRQDETRP